MEGYFEMTTEKLKLYQPSLDDEADFTFDELSKNFQVLDDVFDETVSDVLGYLISGKVYQSGKKIWNRVPNVGGFSGWINLRIGAFAPKWKRETTYNLKDKTISQANNGHYYECIASGTSALSEPAFPTTPDSVFFDLYGHTVWKSAYNYSVDDIVVSTVGDKSYYYKCIIAGTSGVGEPNWTNVSGSTVVDGSVRWFVYKTVIWQEKGLSCEFVPFGAVGDTNTITSVGTITQGTWQAEAIKVSNGGTGATTAKEARKNLSVAGKYKETIGDGTKRVFTINHNLDTQDAVVAVRELGSQSVLISNVVVKYPDVNNVIVEFSVAPTVNQYNVIVIG